MNSLAIVLLLEICQNLREIVFSRSKNLEGEIKAANTPFSAAIMRGFAGQIKDSEAFLRYSAGLI